MNSELKLDNLTYNQHFRIFLNIKSNSPFAMLSNPLTHVALEIDDWRIVELCRFVCQPKSYQECLSFLEDLGVGSTEEAHENIEGLISSAVLIADTTKIFNLWDKYGWREAAYFHFIARNTQFVEEIAAESYADKQLTTLQEYLQSSAPPAFFKKMDGPYRPLEIPASLPQKNLWTILKERKSTRSYKGEDVPEAIVSSILWYGTAKARNSRKEVQSSYLEHPEMLMQSLFSPFEVYIVAHRISGVEPGVYHYDMQNHGFTTIRLGDFEEEVVRLIWGQPMARKTAFTIFISAVFERYMWRYRYNRAYRNLLINMGEFAQLLILAGTVFDLGNCVTPALRDSATDKFLNLNPSCEQTLYYLGFGL